MTDERPWRKSSYSGSQAECVEVADHPNAVLVRDTTDRSRGTLEFNVAAWRAFTAGLKKA